MRGGNGRDAASVGRGSGYAVDGCGRRRDKAENPHAAYAAGVGAGRRAYLCGAVGGGVGAQAYRRGSFRGRHQAVGL